MHNNDCENDKDRESFGTKVYEFFIIFCAALIIIGPVAFLLFVITGLIDKETAEYMGKAMMYGPH